MPGPPPIPFFRTHGVSLFEINGTLRVVVNRQILFAVASWRLLDVDARSGVLALYGYLHGLDGDPWKRVVGGLSPDDAAVAADAIAKRFHLPNVLIAVEHDALERDPRAYHGRHVESAGIWQHAFEHSSFAGAWLDGPMADDAMSVGRGYAPTSTPVRARGLWQCAPNQQYGHLGRGDSAFYAYSIDLL